MHREFTSFRNALLQRQVHRKKAVGVDTAEEGRLDNAGWRVVRCIANLNMHQEHCVISQIISCISGEKKVMAQSTASVAGDPTTPATLNQKSHQ